MNYYPHHIGDFDKGGRVHKLPMVYVLSTSDFKYIKVGKTKSLKQRLINIPPALIILAQLLIAPLTGGWGLVLATPLMVIMMVVVGELYTKKQEAQQ